MTGGESNANGPPDGDHGSGKDFNSSTSTDGIERDLLNAGGAQTYFADEKIEIPEVGGVRLLFILRPHIIHVYACTV